MDKLKKGAMYVKMRKTNEAELNAYIEARCTKGKRKTVFQAYIGNEKRLWRNLCVGEREVAIR